MNNGDGANGNCGDNGDNGAGWCNGRALSSFLNSSQPGGKAHLPSQVLSIVIVNIDHHNIVLIIALSLSLSPSPVPINHHPADHHCQHCHHLSLGIIWKVSCCRQNSFLATAFLMCFPLLHILFFFFIISPINFSEIVQHQEYKS